jgi:peptidoglycan/LPS O-acetylase OafA/YrhL
VRVADQLPGAARAAHRSGAGGGGDAFRTGAGHPRHHFAPADYFASGQLHRYFLNIAGIIHYTLPGVFLDNPVPDRVNGQLWTVPFELECYALLALLAVIGIAWKRGLVLLTVVALQLLLLAHGWFGSPPQSTTVPGRVLVFAFLCGFLLYAYRDRFRWGWLWFAVAAGLSAVLLMVPGGDWLVAGPMAYVTVFLGVTNPRRQSLLLSGDYSYGIFLYGYPIQQLVASLGPDYRHWWINMLIAYPLAVIVAVASWWGIEKPALALKPRLIALEAWMLRDWPRWLTQPIRRVPERLPMLFGMRLRPR